MHQTASEQATVPRVDVTQEEIVISHNAWYSPRWFEFANWIVTHLPPTVSRSIAYTVGQLGFSLCHNRRKAIQHNLSAIAKSPKEERALARACFLNFIQMLHDFCDSAAGGKKRINALVHERRGMEFLEEGIRNGKGTLLITGHLGAWELGGMVLASDGFPVNVVTLEEPTPELNIWRQQYRSQFGIKTITIGSDKFAFIEIIQALRRNELVAMLVDRPYLNSGVTVDFFGRPTLFSHAAAKLFQHTSATIIPAFVLQTKPRSYGCYAYPAIEMGLDQSVDENSQKIASVFQSIIREYPEQWYNFVPIWQSSPLSTSSSVNSL
jgi:Kdo2-lipid IVA lauroyltransferase/acyltransferase